MFDIVFTKIKKKIKLSTSLLGHSNIYNILAAAALGNYLELTDKQIAPTYSLAPKLYLPK